MKMNKKEYTKEKTAFKKMGGILRTSQALKHGIHPRTLYEMRDAGIIEKLSRGLYRLSELPPLENPDLISVALRVPQSVLCLISALAFHEITTQIPHEIYIAVERGTKTPRVDYPPVRIFHFTTEMFIQGIETYARDNITVRVYSPEKTIADCFKYRNKIGLETAIESLKLYRERKKVKVQKLIHFAKICRVENIIKPYLESIL